MIFHVFRSSLYLCVINYGGVFRSGGLGLRDGYGHSASVCLRLGAVISYYSEVDLVFDIFLAYTSIWSAFTAL